MGAPSLPPPFFRAEGFSLYWIYVILPNTEFESNRSIRTSSYLYRVHFNAKFFLVSGNQKLCTVINTVLIRKNSRNDIGIEAL